MSQGGKFITLEGGEGAGKSTQLQLLARELRARGIEVFETREPGGSPGAEAIRDLVLTGERTRWTPLSEALLFAAARADHVARTIRPALERGQWVLSDRFLDSSVAYQGFADGLGYEEIYAINDFACEGLLPDRTLVLVLNEGMTRAQDRDRNAGDRIGGRGSDYHAAVDKGFKVLAESEPNRVRLIDASGSQHDVTRRLLAELTDLLP